MLNYFFYLFVLNFSFCCCGCVLIPLEHCSPQTVFGSGYTHLHTSMLRHTKSLQQHICISPCALTFFFEATLETTCVFVAQLLCVVWLRVILLIEVSWNLLLRIWSQFFCEILGISAFGFFLHFSPGTQWSFPPFLHRTPHFVSQSWRCWLWMLHRLCPAGPGHCSKKVLSCPRWVLQRVSLKRLDCCQQKVSSFFHLLILPHSPFDFIRGFGLPFVGGNTLFCPNLQGRIHQRCKDFPFPLFFLQLSFPAFSSIHH